jgi:hypothetical protein
LALSGDDGANVAVTPTLKDLIGSALPREKSAPIPPARP